jgi:hypothetical protein
VNFCSANLSFDASAILLNGNVLTGTALDGASRSLKREFEEVIMVEILIGEMFGSD